MLAVQPRRSPELPSSALCGAITDRLVVHQDQMVIVEVLLPN
jgi:hypothetical protein